MLNSLESNSYKLALRRAASVALARLFPCLRKNERIQNFSKGHTSQGTCGFLCGHGRIGKLGNVPSLPALSGSKL
jgi:hypothetical protein